MKGCGWFLDCSSVRATILLVNIKVGMSEDPVSVHRGHSYMQTMSTDPSRSHFDHSRLHIFQVLSPRQLVAGESCYEEGVV